MIDTQDIAAILLTVTAVILAALLLIIYAGTVSPVYGDTAIRQGDYMLCAGARSGSTDLVYVTDIAARRLNVYYPNLNANTLELIDTVNLEQAFRD